MREIDRRIMMRNTQVDMSQMLKHIKIQAHSNDGKVKETILA